jgi:hypothetical protein
MIANSGNLICSSSAYEIQQTDYHEKKSTARTKLNYREIFKTRHHHEIMRMNEKESGYSLGLKAGELVEVKSKEEILATLDAQGCLGGLPFMPEMFRYCGRRLQVYKRAHKACDTVSSYRSRGMANAVHLETRCSGDAHGGCQASCLIYWKEAWLRRLSANSHNGSSPARARRPQAEKGAATEGCTEDDVWRSAFIASQNGAKPTYVCQATRLPYATTELNWWDIRQYLEDYRSRNVGITTMLAAFINSGLYHVSRAPARSRAKLVRAIRRLIVMFYDTIPPLWGGPPWPRRSGAIPNGEPTPSETLNLQPGELVRVKPYDQILVTLNKENRNRGMTFDKEMVPYCAGEYRVLKRVNKLIDEKTGEMQEMKNACIVLDSVVCQSRYSECRLFCPRSIYPFWREIWLERVHESGTNAAGGAVGQGS